MVLRLRGHAEARLDDKGRLKMPAHFKKILDGECAGRLFVTALRDDSLMIYPMPVWEEIEAKVEALGKMSTKRRRFFTRANRFGTEIEMDGQGRITLKPAQRDLIGISANDEVVLVGASDYLEMHRADVLDGAEDSGALTDDDFDELGI